MKKQFLLKTLLATLLLLLPTLCSFAYDFEIDGVYYNIISTEKLTVEITSGISNYTGDIVIPSNVENNGKTYSVTKIGESAFIWCESLTSIEIPSSITSIGESAFDSCENLFHITSFNPKPPVCGGYVFRDVDKTKCLLSVPVGSKDVYASANLWKGFLKIEETTSINSVSADIQ